MTNVVKLRRLAAPQLQPSVSGLISLFSSRRRGRHDPYWLKEVAELLQILAATGAEVEREDLKPFEGFVSSLMSELKFFPQYYRFFLSIVLDLRTLGVADAPVEKVADFILENKLYEIELGDIPRGEVVLMLNRAGRNLPTVVDDGISELDKRLSRFARNASTFCLPNRRAAYELTHLVFHASDYGRRPIAKDPERRLSLIYAGMVAWLEGNMDLLAEVVIALRLSGETAPGAWEDAILGMARKVDFVSVHDGASLDDDYHQYFVLNWACAVIGHPSFTQGVPVSGRFVLRQPGRNGIALQELSMALFAMSGMRLVEWQPMRWRMWSKLSAETRRRIEVLEEMDEFEVFFKGFSRAG